MAFSPWQILSPVQWAKWTWSAVRGGPEEDENSQDSGSDSEGTFDIPEADTPMHSPVKEQSQESNNEVYQLFSKLSVDITTMQVESEPEAKLKNTNKLKDSGLDIERFIMIAENDIASVSNNILVTGTTESVSNKNIGQQQQKSTTESWGFLESKKNFNDCENICGKVNEENLDLINIKEMQKMNTEEKLIKNYETMTPPASTNLGNPESKEIKLQLDFEDGVWGEITNIAPGSLQKLGSKTTSVKLIVNSDKSTQLEQIVNMNSDDVPLPSKLNNSNQKLLMEPNVNPYEKKSDLPLSSTLPNKSFRFNKDQFGNSADFANSSKILANSEKDLTDELKPSKESRSANSSPKIAKPHLIKNSCKVQNFDGSSLILDVCMQREDNPPNLATDEEKLASVPAPKSVGSGVKRQAEEEHEFFECSDYSSDIGYVDPAFNNKNSIISGDKVQNPLDVICLNETDRAAVLSLIKEEIFMKETEAKAWQSKHEESHKEVLEMRKIVAEYEKTIAQMIEDDQKSKMVSQKSLQQLSLDKEQALADLNSVERSLSDLFRRYENLKGVLEGFKKNEEALKKCAQDYLARIKQEEHRYQALKCHAEEKLEKANEEIAQVRTKAKAENAALTAGLRKEQMKVESLESTTAEEPRNRRVDKDL